ncbi:MAG TPA: DUF1565 domain-containing protein [Candidatus Saccharimonadaceae bacterium]|nr:DUF1565 domain-containing protein [Candidatus Saccharimonadaceae bacterium]
MTRFQMPRRVAISAPRRRQQGLRVAIATFVLGVALPALALAGSYYVSTSGSDSNAGTQAAPWRTIAKANATLNAGDVVFISPGTYADAVNPQHNGASITQRISYVGSLSNPASVVVNGIWIEHAYVSVKGVTSGGFTLYYTSESAKAVYDSIAWCVATGGGLGSAGSKNCVVANNRISGTVSLLMNNWQPGPPGVINTAFDTIRANVIDVGTITQGIKGFSVRGFVQYCLVDSNRISQFFVSANGGDLAGRYIYNSYFNTFRDNSWHFEADADQASPYVAFALRDSSHDNLFERDSMLCGVQSGFAIGGRLVNAGNAAWTGQCVNNHWKGCYFLTSSYTFNQDLLNNCLIENCVFASRGSYGLYILGDIQNTIIRNCTIASWSGAAMKLEGDPRGGGNQFYSNVFYSDSVAACYSGRAVLFHGYPTGFTQNNNLFFARAATSGVTAANQSLYWQSSFCSAPGPGTSWASATGNDVNSKYGDPKFANTSFANFDPHIRTGSVAIGLGAGGVDAGAYPFGSGQPDVTPPAAITTLASVMVSDQVVTLTWAAPGDDGLVGVAAAYDLRWSTQPITDDVSWAAATSVATEPVPAVPATVQSYVMTGLTPATQYYFAIKTRDEANNWSLLSNVLARATAATDVVPPKSVGDLH